MTTTSSSAAAFDLAMLLPAPPDDSAAPRWRAQAALASNYDASQHALRTSAARTCFPDRSAVHIGTGRSEPRWPRGHSRARSEEHTSELQPLMRISYAVFCFTTQNYSDYS